MNHDARVPDFDTLAALHQQDPQAFEELRCYLLRNAVAAAPATSRPALEALLNRIDAARQSAATPMEAATGAFKMMMESLQELQQSWEQARFAVAGMQASLLIERVRY